MKRWLSVTLAASLLLYPFATYAADYGSQASQTQQAPPVAQALVREGDFAVKLAAELDLGNPTNEAIAEDMLAKKGVVPLNGWISDYPMTPEILGQLQTAIAKAADEGKLPMTSEQATKGLYYLAAKMNLPTPAGSGIPAKEGSQAPAAQPGQTVINNYYYDQGPPVITYYPPPADFVFLYDWVPYPVWWFGFWFPGFFICNKFTTVVVVNARTAIVSNRIIERGTVAVVDPVVRTSTGTVRPVTTLRTGSGETFRTVADLRQVAGASRLQAGRPGSVAKSAPAAQGYRSPEVRKSASAIYSRSIERMQAWRGPEGGTAGERRFVAPSAPGRSYNAPSMGGERRYVAPNQPGRSYNGPVSGGERPYISPNQPGRSYSGSPWGGERRFVEPVPRSFNGPMRSFPGSGGRGGGYGFPGGRLQR